MRNGGWGVITDLLNQRRRATTTERNAWIFQLPLLPAAVPWLNTCQGYNWNHGLWRTKNCIWLMLMNPAKTDGICVRQEKFTVHNIVEFVAYVSGICFNKQVGLSIITVYLNSHTVQRLSLLPSLYSLYIHFHPFSTRPFNNLLYENFNTCWIKSSLRYIWSLDLCVSRNGSDCDYKG